ncbi:MAG TPA: hypothetical protein VFB03_03410, partial [Candidatus Saccharimonadales bacterium]|nr:hypothetical protein [Candidatus Saccharimonadales bacterium]
DVYSRGTRALRSKNRKLWDGSMSLGDLCRQASSDQVAPTRYTQLNLVGNTAAAIATFKSKYPDVVLHDGIGNSVGEFPIYEHAGVMSLEDMVCLVDARGTYMQELAENLVINGVEAGVGAARGLEAEEMIQIVTRVNDENGGQEAGFQAEIAGINTESQVTVTGYITELDLVGAAIKAAGGKFSKLRIAGPVHSRLQKETERRLEAYIGDSKAGPVIDNPKTKSMLSNRSGDFLESSSEVQPAICEHVTHTVQLWPSVQMAMGLRIGRHGQQEAINRTNAVHVFAEMGPGTTMADMYRPLEQKYPGQVYVLRFNEAMITGLDVEAIRHLRDAA